MEVSRRPFDTRVAARVRCKRGDRAHLGDPDGLLVRSPVVVDRRLDGFNVVLVDVHVDNVKVAVTVSSHVPRCGTASSPVNLALEVLRPPVLGHLLAH